MEAAAAFWLALAAVIVGSGYFKSRTEAARHETLRHIIEKTGNVDEVQFRALFPPVPASVWQPKPPQPGSGYRAMRILGTLVLFVAIGLSILFWVLVNLGKEEDAAIGFGIAALVATIGIGLHVAAIFVPKPRSQDSLPPAA